MCFAPGWKNKDKEKALAWIARQKPASGELAKAAAGSTDPEIRKAAIERIRNNNLLIDLVVNKGLSGELAKAAIGSISGDRDLLQLLQESGLSLSMDRCAQIVDKLTEEESLYRIAVDPKMIHLPERKGNFPGAGPDNTDRHMLAERALYRIENPECLKRIVRETQYDHIPLHALRKLYPDKEQLHERCREIAFDNPDRYHDRVRQSVLFELKEDELVSFIEQEKDAPDRREALPLMQEALSKIEDKQRKAELCRKYDLHEWVWTYHDSGPDTLLEKITFCFHCRMNKEVYDRNRQR